MSAEPLVAIGQVDVSRVKGLLFDVDGTLSDSDDLMIEHVVRVLHPLRGLFKNKDVRPFARRLVMAAETPGNFLYRFADFLGIDAYISWILSRTIQHGRSRRRLDVERHLLVNGVQEMLMDLASKYRLAVVSARDVESTSHFLKHFNLAQYFNVIVTAQSCKHTKPYPEPILLAALQLGLLPKACVMVGDTVMDIHAGKAAGAQTIAVLCGFGTLNELIKAEADMILSTTSQLVDIFI